MIQCMVSFLQRYKVMRLGFIPQVQAAWLIHGGKEVLAESKMG
jgi:hypothetical protein